MGETEEFNTLAFEKKLSQLKDTQESIQSLSSWCLKQRSYHKKIVSSWLNVLKRVKVEQRLVLFYLANDVIQYSKRKNYEFVESWGLNLQKATPLVRDEKVRPKILRIFKIWEQRSVYDEEFLTDLTGLLSAGAVKKTDDDPLDFQPQQLFNKIKQCTVLETDTRIKLKCIQDNPLELSDTDELSAILKERSIKHDVEKEINESIQCVERYTQALQREIVAREALLALLGSANQYYSTQRGEVKVVAYAYRNFGARVRTLKRKLDEVVLTLPSAPSPPTRDEDVPSPGPDEDLELPPNDADVSYNIDQTFNTSVSADGSLYNLGLSSFLNEKNLSIFNDSESDIKNLSVNHIKQQETLPGLDLLKEANPAPPTSFYGTMETITIPDEPEQPYLPEAVVTSNQRNNSWNVARPVRSHTPGKWNVFSDPPASPPIVHRKDAQELQSSELEIRSRLPPPPPPPVLPGLTHLKDIDQRIMPSLPPMPVPPPVRHSHQDVDHRNLIPLTQLPALHLTDQDYRIPPMAPPLLPPPATDIVESVDMDLSEDEEQGMYQNQNQSDHRNCFNNNKVLVGGDKKRNDNANLIQITNESHLGPMTNPFDNMPPALRYNFHRNYQDENMENPETSVKYDEDIRNRAGRNQSDGYKDEWHPRQYMNRGQYPRNWGPRFRPPYNQLNQRNMRQRWPGARQRFW